MWTIMNEIVSIKLHHSFGHLLQMKSYTTIGFIQVMPCFCFYGIIYTHVAHLGSGTILYRARVIDYDKHDAENTGIVKFIHNEEWGAFEGHDEKIHMSLQQLSFLRGVQILNVSYIFMLQKKL